MTAVTPRSLPYPLGATLVAGGVDMAVYSETADSIEFCAFDETGTETRTILTERTGHVFHGIVPGAGVGTRYGLRVHGPWDPANGLRHNARKLLLDPHATAVEGEYAWGQAVFGHDQQNPQEMDSSDSAGSTPRCVITDPPSTGPTTPRRAPRWPTR